MYDPDRNAKKVVPTRRAANIPPPYANYACHCQKIVEENMQQAWWEYIIQ